MVSCHVVDEGPPGGCTSTVTVCVSVCVKQVYSPVSITRAFRRWRKRLWWLATVLPVGGPNLLLADRTLYTLSRNPLGAVGMFTPFLLQLHRPLMYPV